MKKLLPFILTLLIISCNRHGNDQSLKPGDQVLNYGAKFDKLLLGVESTSSQLTLTSELKVESQDITLPVGTILQKVENDPTTFSYTLPSEYKIVAQNSDGKARLAAGGSITCSCTQGQGCSPYVASLGKNQSIGCAATGNYTKCNMSLTGGSPRAGDIGETLSNAEIIDFNNPIHFVTTKAELSTLVSPSHAMMEQEEVRQQIVSFAEGYQIDDLDALNKSTGPSDLPATYTYVHINVYGRVILLPVQTNLVNAANPLINEILRSVADANGRIAATVYKCKCNSGTAGCSLSSGNLRLAKAVYCEAASCTSCTLSWL